MKASLYLLSGEKLSQKQLKLESTIKNLRAKEKESEATITSLKEQLAAAEAQVETSTHHFMASPSFRRAPLTLSLSMSASLLSCVLARKQDTRQRLPDLQIQRYVACTHMRFIIIIIIGRLLTNERTNERPT